jgi:hypothetical protein
MIKVKFTADVYNPDTEETFNGYVDPTRDMFQLRSDLYDVPVFEFDFMADAMEFVEDAIGIIGNSADGSFYAQDARLNAESGEYWNYAAHVSE